METKNETSEIDAKTLRFLEGLTSDRLNRLLGSRRYMADVLKYAQHSEVLTRKLREILEDDFVNLSGEQRVHSHKLRAQVIQELRSLSGAHIPQAVIMEDDRANSPVESARSDRRTNVDSMYEHVSISDLLRFNLDNLSEREITRVSHHLQEEHCRECNRKARIGWLGWATAAIQTGRRTVDQIESLLNLSLYGEGEVRLPILQYASRQYRRIPFSMYIERDDLSLLVEEREGDTLLIRVETRDERFEDRLVHVEIVGETRTLSISLMLKKRESYYEGQHYFETFSGMQKDFEMISVFAIPADEEINS